MTSSLRDRVTAMRRLVGKSVRQMLGKPPVVPPTPQGETPSVVAKAAPPKPPELPPNSFATLDEVRDYLRLLAPANGQPWITTSTAESRDLLFAMWSGVIEHRNPKLTHRDVLKVIGEESIICDAWAWKVLTVSDPEAMVPHLETLERWQHPAIEEAKAAWMNDIVPKVYDPKREMKETPLTPEEHEALRARFRRPFEQEEVITTLLTWSDERTRMPSDLLPLLAQQPLLQKRSILSMGLVATLGRRRKWASGAQRAETGAALLAEPKLWEKSDVRALCWGLLADHPELWWSVLQHRSTWPPLWETQWLSRAETAITAAPAAAARAVLQWDIAMHGAMPRTVIRWALLQKNRDVRTKGIAHAGEIGTQPPSPGESARAEEESPTPVPSSDAHVSRHPSAHSGPGEASAPPPEPSPKETPAPTAAVAPGPSR